MLLPVFVLCLKIIRNILKNNYKNTCIIEKYVVSLHHNNNIKTYNDENFNKQTGKKTSKKRMNFLSNIVYNGWVYEKVCLDELSNYH